jgi:maltose O-acetyltransferase
MLGKLWRLVRHDLPCHFALVLTNWLPDSVVVLRLRGALVRPFLRACGRDLRVGRNVTFYNPANISLGRHVYVAYGCWLMAGDPIEIGDEVMFGPYCVVVSSNHTRRNRSFRYGSPMRAPIKVGCGAWLGAHSVLTAGCVVGNGSLVAALSVVRGEVPPDTMVAGQPARVITAVVDELEGTRGGDGG